ncbi:MAG: glycine cleavage system aminomethyltransferase GcvT, partial [Dehalococcoidia bacterium]|nr:glycine cleavage system aminomethyltransferase GcvT [Dehalococcoidia bacterium]
MLKQTVLYPVHLKLGATMGEFAGFEHALWYEGIIPEHLAVRDAVGLFDITHMGRCTVRGVNAAALLDYLLTRNIPPMKTNQGHYTVMCNNHGAIIDDLVVFRLDEDTFFLVYNASNREKDYKWIYSHAKDFNVQTRDVSDEVAMFAIQGPKALPTLQSLSNVDLSDIRRYWGHWVNLNDLEVFLTRTGYTGEDGFEVYLWNTPLEKPERAEKLWQTILKAGEEYCIKPCGLGARDTLRLEAGMCLYGNDIDEDTTPLEAKLTFTINFEKDNFIGKDALLRHKDEGLKRIRIGLRMLKRGIPRRGYEIFLDGEKIGRVTSGTFSPLLQRGIGMGYVPPEHAAIETQVDIKIRKSFLSAE